MKFQSVRKPLAGATAVLGGLGLLLGQASAAHGQSAFSGTTNSNGVSFTGTQQGGGGGAGASIVSRRHADLDAARQLGRQARVGRADAGSAGRHAPRRGRWLSRPFDLFQRPAALDDARPHRLVATGPRRAAADDGDRADVVRTPRHGDRAGAPSLRSGRRRSSRRLPTAAVLFVSCRSPSCSARAFNDPAAVMSRLVVCCRCRSTWRPRSGCSTSRFEPHTSAASGRSC